MKRCELNLDPLKRAAARKRTSAIQANFPDGLAQPALRALVNAGFTKLEQLTRISEVDLVKLHGMGPKAVALLRDALAKKNLALLPH